MTKHQIDTQITKLQVEALVKFDRIKNSIETRRYERQIKKSQKKLAETTPVSYTQVIS